MQIIKILSLHSAADYRGKSDSAAGQGSLRAHAPQSSHLRCEHYPTARPNAFSSPWLFLVIFYLKLAKLIDFLSLFKTC